MPFKAYCANYTVGETESLADGIIDYKLSSVGSSGVQNWIDGYLTDNAGNGSEWYVVGLAQSGSYDFSSYEEALLRYLDSQSVISPTSMEKFALALSAVGSTNKFITETLESAVGEQGIMSLIYGLHILNNGHTSAKCSVSSVTKELLDLQYADGGWALFGENGDVDVTAMTVQALAPRYNSDSSVKSAVDKALTFLSNRQESSGGYRSFGDVNPESSAQVLVALSALGIDCQNDERFIKNGNSVLSAMLSFRLSDGSFSHTDGGASNSTATIQAYYSLVAYSRLKHGKAPLLILDKCFPVKSSSHYDQPTSSKTSEKTTQQQATSHVSTVVDTANGNENADTHLHNNVQPTEAPHNGDSDSDTNTITSQTTSPAENKKDTSNDISSSLTSATTQTTNSCTALTSTLINTTNTDTYISDDQSQSLTGTVIVPMDEGSSASSKGGYKPVAILIISGTACLLCGIIFIIGKRNYKNFIAVGIAAAVGIVFVLVTDFQSTDHYYNGQKKRKDNAIGTVTLSIRCDTIAGKGDPAYVPEDGTILDTTEFDIEDGETVYDILTEAARTYRIQVENKGSSGSAHGMVYIAGINYIYEMDYGDLSGWVYHVNGITPSRSCGEYILSDGDNIEWLYTCELGHDLNEVYE